MRSQRKGLAQFFGEIRAGKWIESIAENLCLTLLKQGRCMATSHSIFLASTQLVDG
jgi:hypothetical protein